MKGWNKMEKNKKRMIIITIAVIVLIAIDQIAKFFIIGKDINIILLIYLQC